MINTILPHLHAEYKKQTKTHRKRDRIVVIRSGGVGKGEMGSRQSKRTDFQLQDK